MASTISAARVALFNKLEQAAAGGGVLSDVQISWGDPLAYEEQEVVALLGISAPDEVPASLGNLSRDESYGIEVRIKVYGPEDDAATVDGRAFAMADAVRSVVNVQPPTLSGTVRFAQVTSQRCDAGVQPVLNESGSQTGWICFIDMTVGCSARV